jgi:hypothetical protein
MDSMKAFAMGRANKGRPHMVFDWHKAAELIRDRKPAGASAGLAGDWEYTGGEICRNGDPVMDGGTYLASTWATPELDLDGDVMDCFVNQSETPEWEAETTWPESALKILSGETVEE